MKTKIMGILNITPDSFSDGGDYFNNPTKAVTRVKKMIAEGADYIDIGGESTRPGSEDTSTKEELRRVIPVITEIRKELGEDIRLSIDTYKSEVAKEALLAGVNAINSLGGFLFDKSLAQVVAKHKCMIIMYHIKGKPKTMQQGKIEYTDVCQEINDFFTEQLEYGESQGIKKDSFILDPGIGFGKTADQNIEIIQHLGKFKKFNLPILIGISRKSHLGMIIKNELGLETDALERLEGSLAETAVAVTNGATVVRTHDIIQTRKFLAVLEKFL
jgi:dihydropteroate synthase